MFYILYYYIKFLLKNVPHFDICVIQLSYFVAYGLPQIKTKTAEINELLYQ